MKKYNWIPTDHPINKPFKGNSIENNFIEDEIKEIQEELEELSEADYWDGDESDKSLE